MDNGFFVTLIYIFIIIIVISSLFRKKKKGTRDNQLPGRPRMPEENENTESAD